MKKTIIIILCLTISISCGKKSHTQNNPITKKFEQTLLKFGRDINNPSTIDYQKLKDYPQVLDLKDKMTGVRNQDTRGTCSFFTTIGLVESAIKIKTGKDINLSEEYLNYIAKTNLENNNDDEGSTPNLNLYALIKSKAGFLLESDWPYQPLWFEMKEPCLKYKSDDSKAPKECFSHNSPDKNILKRQLPSESFDFNSWTMDDTNDLFIVMNEQKSPINISLPVNMNGWNDSGEVQYTEELREECLNTPSKCGGHAVILTGYDINKKVFFFKNSWGKEWGQEGYGTLPFDMVDRHVRRNGYVTVALNKELVIPQGDSSPIEINNYKLNSKENADHSISVSTKGTIKNANLYYLKISSLLMQKENSNTDLPNDKNTKEVELTTEEQKKYNLTDIFNGHYIFPQEDSLLDLEKGKLGEVKISSDKMTIPSVANLNVAIDNNFVLRTSLYQFTDEGYVLLKRNFHQINNFID